jgi:hypothetical protein
MNNIFFSETSIITTSKLYMNYHKDHWIVLYKVFILLCGSEILDSGHHKAHFKIWTYGDYTSIVKLFFQMGLRLLLRARSTTLFDKVCQWLATGFLQVLRFPPLLNTIQPNQAIQMGHFDCNHMVVRMLWVRLPVMSWCTRYNVIWSSLSVIWGRFSSSTWTTWFPPPIKLTTMI